MLRKAQKALTNTGSGRERKMKQPQGKYYHETLDARAQFGNRWRDCSCWLYG
jgi:hypothetical protein